VNGAADRQRVEVDPFLRLTVEAFRQRVGDFGSGSERYNRIAGLNRGLKRSSRIRRERKRQSANSTRRNHLSVSRGSERNHSGTRAKRSRELHQQCRALRDGWRVPQPSQALV
jgi:hypothetical protein